ncbi:AAA family ATPase [Acinetobacter pollinis]|uniref:AAA family ATPase n=2 Tax=Acinetobacter pollinis TaxID=2605270 RepID=A0ABU6DQR0_9GAMM|nr:AAA family ATPase [Acinetobacter pollinis]
MKIKGLSLHDVGGIESLVLDNLNPQMNIICGENGVGKTNILDSIAYLFSNWSKNQIKKRYGTDFGQLTAHVITSDTNIGSALYEVQAALQEFDPSERDSYRADIDPRFAKQVIYLRVTRDLEYQRLKGIESDPDEKDYGTRLIEGLSSTDLKSWFIGRFYQSAAGNLEEQFKSNFETAKTLFSELNENYAFHTVTRKNEIIVRTPMGDEIPFEYLSSGFKSSILILMGIIKEIELRFQSKLLRSIEYDGIILIDEIELHLHPEWQGVICNTLKKIFPNAQFFISTHSPHVVQTALKGEVIALERTEGVVKRRALPESEYGYQGWTIEEILEDVMGMVDLRTQNYKAIKQQFDEALDKNDRQSAQLAYDQLDKMLHPDYPLRTVFQMQLNSLGE